MKKYLIFIGFMLLVNCSNDIIVGTESICEKDKSIFERIFTICMNGQRHTTGTDDADDFVIECRNTAQKESITRCTYDYYFYHYSNGEGRTSADKLCKDAETEKEKKACYEYGYRITNIK